MRIKQVSSVMLAASSAPQSILRRMSCSRTRRPSPPAVTISIPSSRYPQSVPRLISPRRRGALLALVALATILLAILAQLVRVEPAMAAPNAFVTRSGAQLMLDGEPFRFSGANVPWLGLESDNYARNSPGGADLYYPSEYQVIDAFATVNEMGGTVVRSQTLGASQGCSLCIEPALGQFNEQALRQVDYAIASAAAHHIRLIIPLVDNNWGWYYGGTDIFAGWRGVPNSSFYTDPQVIADYEQFVSTLLNHVNTYTGVAYKDDPIIMAWELGNELGSSTVSWTASEAAYVKSIDPNHLVMDGSNVLSSSRLAIPDVDMYSGHYYVRDGTPQPWPTVANATEVASAQKVFCVCEYGWDATNLTQQQLSSNLSTITNDSAVSGDLFWALEPHADLGGWAPVDQSNCASSETGAGRAWWGLYYTGLTTACQTSSDMAQRAQILRAHAYAMSGQAVPAHAVPAAPSVISARYGVVTWQGAAAAASYSIQRAGGPDGPWTTVCAGCVTDSSGPWTDPAAPAGVSWYRVIGINLDGVVGPPSPAVSSAPDGTTAWVEDALPPGSTAFADGGDSWTWVTANPDPYSGNASSQSAIAAGEHQHYFTRATDTISPSQNSLLYTWVYLDPAHLPSGIILQWNTGQPGDLGWSHRAYWGNNCTIWGTEGTASRYKVGALPPGGGWVRLTVQADDVGVAGVAVSGMAFTTCDGRATFDHSGLVP